MSRQAFLTLFLKLCILATPLLPRLLSASSPAKVIDSPPISWTAPIAGSAPAWAAPALPSAPLMFIENVGQFDERIRFQLHSSDRTIWLTEDAIWVKAFEQGSEKTKKPGGGGPPHLHTPTLQPRSAVNLKLSFVDANLHSRLEPFERLDTQVSYFIGNDQDQWHTDVPVWRGVRYVDLYPGVDLEITGENGRMTPRLVCRSDCRLALRNVHLRVEGARALALDGNYLRLTTDLDNFTLPLFLIVAADGSPANLTADHPNVDGIEISAPFALSPTQSFASTPASSLASQDNLHDLLYSTFLGGNNSDYCQDIALDETGSVYVTGYTSSSDFPFTPGAFDTSADGQDAFVAKVNSTGTGLVYAAFLGGGGGDRATGVAVDALGNAYLTGSTGSTDFPATPGAYDTTCDDWICSDVFVAKMNPEETDLVYATYIGGRGFDSGSDISVDEAGNAYVVGTNDYGDFPATPGAFDTGYNGGQSVHNMGDVFVVKLNVSGTGLTYATYLGGENADYGSGIATDDMGNVYVTGSTKSSNFPTSLGAFDTTCGTDGNCNEDFPTSLGYGGPADAFVVKLNTSGTGLIYATFLGARDADSGNSIALDGSGYIYVTGRTASSDFPTTSGAFDRTCGTDGNCNPDTYPRDDAFVARVNANGTGLTYATFLGGSDDDRGVAIAIDEAGSAYVTGRTYSLDFPTTSRAFDTTCGTDSNCDPDSYGNPTSDVFAARMNAAGSSLAYSTFLGGNDADYGYGIAVDKPGRILVTGSTGSTNFPVTLGVFDTTYNGGYSDAFVAKLLTEGVVREARADVGMPYASGGYRGCPSPYVGCGGPYRGFYYGVCTDLVLDAYNAGVPFNVHEALYQDHLAHPGRYRYGSARNPEDMRRYFYHSQQWLPHSQAYQPGDIVFFNWGTDGLCDHVGVVSEVDAGGHPTRMVHATGVCSVNPSGRAFEQDWNSHYEQHVQGHGRIGETGSLLAPADEPLQLLRITVDSPAVALSLQDANGKSTSATYDENLIASGVEASIPYIPGGSYADLGTEQVITITWPLSNTSQYFIELTGQSAATYQLRVETLLGASVTDSEAFTQTIATGETHGSAITLSTPGGTIELSATAPTASPLPDVPESLELTGLVGTSAQVSFTITETGEQRVLQSVALSATELMDSLGGMVSGSLLVISPDDFTVLAGDSQQVDVQVDLAGVAPGAYWGAMMIRSDNAGTRMIPLTLVVQFHLAYLPIVFRGC